MMVKRFALRHCSKLCFLVAVLFFFFYAHTAFSQNYSLNFDGNDYVTAPSTGVPFGSNPRTVELWFKTGTTPASYMSLFTQGSNIPGGLFNFRVTSTGRVQFCNWYNLITGTTFVTDNQWHHYAITYSNSVTTIYIDGNQEASAVYTLNTSTSNSILRFGCMFTTAPQYEYFSGNIDEVRFWNVARTPEQLTADMNHRLEGTEAGLVGYWRFDEGSGNSTADASGHNLTGSLTSTTWSTDTPFSYSNISVRPASINFGTIAVGNTVRDSVWLINRELTARTLTICRISVAQYAAQISIPYMIPSMDSVAIPILFTPDTIGTFRDSLRLEFSNGVSFRVPVQGSGTGVVFTTTEPAPPDTLWFGYPTQIRWIASGITGVVWIEVNRSYPEGAWQMISGIMNAGVRQFAWTVDGEESDSVRFRITSASSGLVTSTSGNLAIRRRSLTLLDHHGEVPLFVGSLDTIRWSYQGVGETVGIAIARNGFSGGLEPVISAVPAAQGYYAWTITGPTSDEARFLLYSVAYPELVDSSESAVTISRALLEYSPNFLAFGDTRIHSARNDTITFRNQGTVPITIHDITGGMANGYSRNWINLPADSSILAGDSIQLQVCFLPDTTGSFIDTIRIAFQLPFPVAMIPLSGFGYGSYAELSDATMRFSNVLEPGGIDSMKTWIKCTGGNRVLTDVRFLTTNPAYLVYPPDLSNIASGDSAQFTVFFHPIAIGSYHGQVIITSNAVNYDTIRLGLTGYSEYYPAVPAGLTITVDGENSILNWDRVEVSISGAPITVDRYIVFFRAVADGPWYYLGSTIGANSLTYQHDRVVRHSPAMYYQIRAWLDNEVTGDFWNSLPGNIPISEEELFRQMKRYNSQGLGVQEFQSNR